MRQWVRPKRARKDAVQDSEHTLYLSFILQNKSAIKGDRKQCSKIKLKQQQLKKNFSFPPVLTVYLGDTKTEKSFIFYKKKKLWCTFWKNIHIFLSFCPFFPCMFRESLQPGSWRHFQGILLLSDPQTHTC